MVKIIIAVFTLTFFVWSDNAYERHCVSCHRELPTSLQRMFMYYLGIYSGEKSVKVALKRYMRNPFRDVSVMPELFLDTYGIKQPLKLDERELEEAIEIYWETYQVHGRLK